MDYLQDNLDSVNVTKGNDARGASGGGVGRESKVEAQEIATAAAAVNAEGVAADTSSLFHSFLNDTDSSDTAKSCSIMTHIQMAQGVEQRIKGEREGRGGVNQTTAAAAGAEAAAAAGAAAVAEAETATEGQ